MTIVLKLSDMIDSSGSHVRPATWQEPRLKRRAAGRHRVGAALLGEHPVDLVMLGAHGRGGLDRLMVGRVASAVARKAPCSVLLISPDAALAQNIAEAVTDRTTPAWHRELVPAT